MQVYKVFFKIIKRNFTEIAIYIGVFLFFAVFVTSVNKGTDTTGFKATKINIAFFNEDEGSVLVEGLKDYLGERANIVNIEDDEKKLQDALFYRNVEYIIRVPKGFSDSLASENELMIEKSTVPDSASGMYINMMVNKFLNTAKLYKSHLGDNSDETLLGYIKSDLDNETEVTVNSFNSSSETKIYNYYYNYLSYSVFGIMILGVCTIMLVFNDKDIKRRNTSSPIRLRSINTQLVFGFVSYAAICWLLLIFPSFIMYWDSMVSIHGLLLILNALIFTITALSISFFIANAVKSRGAMSAVSNVVSLGSSFISGAFVPQQLLGQTVLKIASFTPTYWYIKANNTISETVSFNAETLMSVFNSMLIEFVFAVAFLAVTLVIMKQKRTAD